MNRPKQGSPIDKFTEKMNEGDRHLENARQMLVKVQSTDPGLAKSMLVAIGLEGFDAEKFIMADTPAKRLQCYLDAKGKKSSSN